MSKESCPIMYKYAYHIRLDRLFGRSVFSEAEVLVWFTVIYVILLDIK